jgi:hypothetical protein
MEEHRLRVFENKVLREHLDLWEEVVVGWRRLHNEELHNLYVSLSIMRVIKSRRMRWAGHAAHMREMRNAHKILVGKPEMMRPLRRPRRRRNDIIRMDLRERGLVGCGLDAPGSK